MTGNKKTRMLECTSYSQWKQEDMSVSVHELYTSDWKQEDTSVRVQEL